MNIGLRNIYIYYLSDLDYELSRKNFIEGLKRMKYDCHYNDEYLDMYCRTQLTIDEVEHLLGYEYIDAKTIDYEKPPGLYDLSDINTAFPTNLEV